MSTSASKLAFTLVGTPEYVAPEVLLGQGYGMLLCKLQTKQNQRETKKICPTYEMYLVDSDAYYDVDKNESCLFVSLNIEYW